MVSGCLSPAIGSNERGSPPADGMADVLVLDTSALIAWPISEISGSLIIPAQETELRVISPDRGAILGSVGAIMNDPNEVSLDVARDAAIETGDISGLSKVDLSLVALAYEKSAILVTDDYRMQNVSTAIGIEWRPIGETGITQAWNWELRCLGCKIVQPPPKSPNRRRSDFGECPECGSELKLKRA